MAISYENAVELANCFISTASPSFDAKTIDFFYEIITKHPNPTTIIPEKFKRNNGELKSNIQSYHIDLAIAALYKQKELPRNILESIDIHIKNNQLPEIHELTNHSLGVLEQTLHLIDNLKLFEIPKERDHFLKQLISAIVIHHERLRYDPCHPDNDYTYENAVLKIKQYITSEWNISKASDLNKLVEFLIDRIIILGTINIYSATRTMSLAELYFVFEDIANQVGLTIVHESNKNLVFNINITMLTLSVCKKNPSALYDIAALTDQQTKTNILPLLKRYHNQPLLIEEFFQSNNFYRYFGKRKSLDAINQQAFLISIAAQLRFQAKHKKCKDTKDILKFIKTTRIQYKMHESIEMFMEYFTTHAYQTNMLIKIERVFFTTMKRRSTYRLSQVGSLVFTANKLISMGLSPRSMTVAATGLFQPLINPDAARIDAKNLKAFNDFFNQLKTTALKQRLINEILLTTIIQPDIIHYSPTPQKPSIIKINATKFKKAKTTKKIHHDNLFAKISISTQTTEPTQHNNVHNIEPPTSTTIH